MFGVGTVVVEPWECEIAPLVHNQLAGKPALEIRSDNEMQTIFSSLCVEKIEDLHCSLVRWALLLIVALRKTKESPPGGERCTYIIATPLLLFVYSSSLFCSEERCLPVSTETLAALNDFSENFMSHWYELIVAAPRPPKGFHNQQIYNIYIYDTLHNQVSIL